MRIHLYGSILAVVTTLALAPAVRAQTSTPDISGIWAPQPGEVRSFVDQAAPLTPWAAEIFKTNRSGVGDPKDSGLDELDPSIYCLPDGFPRVYLVSYPFELIQTPKTVYQLFEDTHLVRRIYLDGRKMPENYPPSFMGYSTGHWQGDTLVTETAGFNELTWLNRMGIPHSSSLQVAERIRRPDHNTLEVELLFKDPKAFTKDWGGKKVFALHPDWEIMEHNGFCEDRERYNYSHKTLMGTKDWLKPGY